MRCKHCNSAHSTEALFCSACGAILSGGNEIECENHSGTNATGVCIVCGKPVCDDCSITHAGKIYCDDVTHSAMTTTHSKAAAAGTEFDADVLAKNLAANGVAALVFSARRYSQFCRLTDDDSVSIFVKTELMQDAHRLIEELELTDFLYHENNANAE